jgi:hypothetical protein
MEEIPDQAKPKVQLFNACLIGMKNYMNSKCEFGVYKKNLEESHSCVDKLHSLFVDTLKWDSSDVTVFKDMGLSPSALRKNLGKYKETQNSLN